MPHLYRSFVFALAAFTLFMFSGHPAYAQEQSVSESKKSLVFGVVTSGNCDKDCVLQTNTFFAISNDYLRNVASAMNVAVEFKSYPNIDELLFAVEHDEVLGAVGFSRTKQRESRFLFSEPLFRSQVAVWYLDDSLSNTPASELSWACVKGSSYCAQLEHEGISKIYYAQNADEAMSSMQGGKSNAFISSFVLLSRYLDNKNVVNGSIETPSWVTEESVSLITSKNNQWLIDKVNRVIALEQSGANVRTIVSTNRYHTIERRLQKYLAVRGSSRAITYSTSPNSYPFLFRDENGDLDGFLFDFFELIKSRSGLDFEYVEPTDVLKGKLSSFDADIVPVAYTQITSIPNWQLTNSFMSLNYVAVTKSGVSMPSKNREKVGILSGIEGKGLVHLVGWRDSQVSQYNDFLGMVNDLKEQVIDVAYIPQEFAHTILLGNDASELEVGEHDSLKVHLALATKNNPELNALLNSLFNSIDENELKKVMRSHRSINLVNGVSSENLWQMGAGAFSILIFLGLFAYFLISNLKLKVELAESSANQEEKEKEWLKSIIVELDSWVFIHDRNNNLLLSNCSLYLNKQCQGCKVNENLSNQYLVDNEEEIELVLGGQSIMDCHEVNGCENNLRYVSRRRKAIRSVTANTEYVLTVLDDISEQKQRESELIAAREEAQQAVSAREQFLATMSHELRTPIAAIQGLLELASLREKYGQTADLLAQAQKSTRHLNVLVDEVLDFSKLNAQQLVLNPTKVNLLELLCESIRSFEQAAHSKDLIYQVDINPIVCRYVLIDEVRLVQILNNLLSNAIKFTSSGFVKIEVSGTQCELKLSISDSGIGMSTEQIAKVLKPFTQADAGVTRQYGGSGLGLSIVDKLVNCMDGNMSVESIPNVGSVFRINIPLECVEQEDRQLARFTYSESLPVALKQWCRIWGMSAASEHEYSNISLDEKGHIQVMTNSNVRESISLEECRYPSVIQNTLIQSDTDNSRPIESNALIGKVLVAEDNGINQTIIRMQLDEIGVQHHIVSNGKEAIDYLNLNQDVSVVLTDFHMPVMDGFELTRLIKSSEVYGHLPVIGITAEDARVAKELGKESGQDAVLCKPYSIDILRLYLKEHLNEVSSMPTWLTPYSERERPEFADIFIQTMEQDLAALKNSDNLGAKRKALHRIKGALGAVGMSTLAQQCKQIEKACDEELDHIAAEFIQKLNAEIDATKVWRMSGEV
ncbi:ATP-binding protein [Vibrio hepatarius]|uniref:ATP-binding protein n=1 Tax=Vibrio hepatarius TaxID=171383 RepID=UPI003736281D